MRPLEWSMEKMEESGPSLKFKIMGVYFLPFYQKTTLSASKWQFIVNYQNYQVLALFWVLEVKLQF